MASETKTVEKAAPFERLPTDILPVHYDLLFAPDLDAFTFTGTASIQLNVTAKEAVRCIRFNCKELEFNTVKLDGRDVHARLIPEQDLAEIALESPLHAGSKAVLTIEFTGVLNDKMAGFYRAMYKDKDGKERANATTQFESTDARRAFPCWDEPAMKATFGITLIAPETHVAISNMPEVSCESVAERPGYKRHVFDRTPIMSTYLVAFIVGEFDFLETVTKNGTQMRVFVPPGKKHEGQFALDFGRHALEYYEHFFGIPYPLPKLDQIALSDFSAGAMENWGLVTYREVYLLMNEEHSSTETKLMVAIVIAHELSHQWFGNIVTMNWWTSLWLNEGFATWAEYHCTDALHKEWRLWENFVSSAFKQALTLDALQSSHPVEAPIDNPLQIAEIFDAISYAKGSCVVRMLENYLGADGFRQGIGVYLRKYRYANAATDDLWAELERHSGKPVERMMSAWTKQIGYPLITVEAAEYVDGGRRMRLKLSQQRFFIDGVHDNDVSLWPVPITVSFGTALSSGPSQPNTSHLVATSLIFDQRSGELMVDVPNNGSHRPTWFKLNFGQTSLFRVRYDNETFSSLLTAVRTRDYRLTASDRMGLINDAASLARAGLMPVVRLFELLSAFRDEKDATVWKEINDTVSSLTLFITNDESRLAFASFVERLYTNILQELGWRKKPSESDLQTMLRGELLAFTGIVGVPSVVQEARRLFQKHVSDGAKSDLDSDLKVAVFSTAVAFGDDKVFNDIRRLAKETDSHEEQERLLDALALAPTSKLYQQFLDLLWNKDEVRLQSLVHHLRNTGRNLAPFAIPAGQKWIYENWDRLLSAYGEGGWFVGALIGYLEYIDEEDNLREAMTFFDGKKKPAAEGKYKQAIERALSNIAYKQRDLEIVLQCFLQ